MAQRLLDTSILIRFWRQRVTDNRGLPTRETAVRWARELIRLRATNAIASPVLIEFLAGTRSAQELRLHRAFLAEFEVVDRQITPPDDWREAQRLAQRVPRIGKPRQLGDCLIRAIANRLRFEVVTHDDHFA